MHKVHLGNYGSELCNARISSHILLPVLVRYITDGYYKWVGTPPLGYLRMSFKNGGFMVNT